MRHDELVDKYLGEGKAAGAVALGLESVKAADWIWFPDAFRSLVLYKQNLAILKLSAIAAGTSLQRLHDEWQKQEQST